MKRFAVILIGFVVALPAFAQSPPPELVLQQLLGLESSQVAAIQNLNAQRRAAIEPLVAQMRPLEQELAAAIESASPDASGVGALVLSIRALQRQIMQHDQNARAAFADILTPAQRGQLEAIRGVEAAIHAIEALRLLGL